MAVEDVEAEVAHLWLHDGRRFGSCRIARCHSLLRKRILQSSNKYTEVTKRRNSANEVLLLGLTCIAAAACGIMEEEPAVGGSMSSSRSKPFVATPLTPFTTPLTPRPALRSLPDLEGYLQSTKHQIHGRLSIANIPYPFLQLFRPSALPSRRRSHCLLFRCPLLLLLTAPLSVSTPPPSPSPLALPAVFPIRGAVLDDFASFLL